MSIGRKRRWLTSSAIRGSIRRDHDMHKFTNDQVAFVYGSSRTHFPIHHSSDDGQVQGFESVHVMSQEEIHCLGNRIGAPLG